VTETIHYVCDSCGHIEPRPDHSDPSYRCENCSSPGEQRGYALLDQALDRSDSVLSSRWERSRAGGS
jgi:hypothetical protein